jgi:hypothetical protein
VATSVEVFVTVSSEELEEAISFGGLCSPIGLAASTVLQKKIFSSRFGPWYYKLSEYHTIYFFQLIHSVQPSKGFTMHDNHTQAIFAYS